MGFYLPLCISTRGTNPHTRVWYYCLVRWLGLYAGVEHCRQAPVQHGAHASVRLGYAARPSALMNEDRQLGYR